MIHFSCPACRTGIAVPDHEVGKTTRCPHCTQKVRAPSPMADKTMLGDFSIDPALLSIPGGSVAPVAQPVSPPPPGFYYSRDRRKHGPVTLQFLSQLVAEKKIGPEDMVLCPGSTKWRRAREVHGLVFHGGTAQPLAPATLPVALVVPPRPVVSPPQAILAAPAGPAQRGWYYTLGDSQPCGPVSFETLQQMAANGSLLATDLIVEQGDSTWSPSGSVLGLVFQVMLDGSPPETSLKHTGVSGGYVANGYVASNLLPGEEVMHWAEHHWFIILSPCILIGMAIVILLLANAVNEDSTIIVYFGRGLAFIGLISLVNRSIIYFTSEFAVTTKRIIWKRGFIHRDTLELFHDKIESVSVHQGIFGRIFDFGDIQVNSMQSFPFVADPLELRRQVQAMAVR